MNTSTRFREYDPDQLLLLPADLRAWLPSNHVAYFILDLVRDLDLSSFYESYDGSLGGQPPYDPRMMVSLLLFAYSQGITSSRKMEHATYDSVAFRVLCLNQHPDHDTISTFRQRHLEALSGMFPEVLQKCRKADLVRLGHVAVDGTKVKANASKHKAMSYGRMKKKLSELEADVRRYFQETEATDKSEDALYGKGKRGDEPAPGWEAGKGRQEKIRAALAELEAETQAEYPAKQAAYKEKVKKRKRRKGPGRKPKPPSRKPDSKKQRNFTDSDSRIMVSGGTYVQAYNCQAAVDEKTQDTTIKTKLTSFNPRESKPTSLPRSTDTEIPYLSALEARYRKLPQPKSGWPGSYSPLKADAHMQRESKSSNLCLDRLKNSVDLTASPSEDSRKSLQNGI